MALPVEPSLPADYGDLLARVRAEITGARVRAALKVNEEQVALYWRIGREILDRQAREGWGTKVVARLAADLRHEFPGMQGLSRTNLMRMRAFAAAWPQDVPRTVGQLPWGHNSDLLDKLDDPAERAWYAEQAVEHGWTRALLQHHLATKLIERRGGAVSNFAERLPAERAELAQAITRDPYHLPRARRAGARTRRRAGAARRPAALHAGTRRRVRVRRQPAPAGGRRRRVLHRPALLPRRAQLLRGHRAQARQVPPRERRPAQLLRQRVDAQLRRAHHNPTIGLVLCASRNETVARYMLQAMDRPIGVSSYAAGASPDDAALPADLPSPAQLAEGVSAIVARHPEVETVTGEIVDA